MAKNRFGNYTFNIVVGTADNRWGYNSGDISGTSMGTIDRIAKNAGVPSPDQVFVDLNGDFRAVIQPFGTDWGRAGGEIVVNLEGYDTTINAGTPTSYGRPIRLRFDEATDAYSTAGLLGGRADLLAYMQSLVGEEVRFSVTAYVKP